MSLGLVHITTVPESLGFLDGQLPYIAARGFDVSAISSPGPALDAFAARHGVTVKAIPMTRKLTPWADLRALVQLVRELRRIRPTIVHSHTPKAGLLGSLAGLIAGVPIRVYHLRGLPLATATGPKRRLLRLAERITCAAATRVIAVSASLRSEVVRSGLCPTDKITVLAGGSGQGVDADVKFAPERRPEQRRASRERFDLPLDAFVIVFLGRLVRDKGIVELADAFTALALAHPDVYLLVAGGREDRDSAPPETLAALESHPRVRMLGYESDAPAIYAAADVVVLPTYREGFPNVALEAAAMRKPIVASRVTGCVDAVVDAVTGLLVPAGDAAALADGIARYHGDRELGARHGVAGRERVVREFAPVAIWQALAREYTDLVEHAPRPHYARIKRATDVVLSSLALTALAVPMAAIAAAITIRMGGAPVFAQARPGRGERSFQLYKFRTMTNARDERGELLPDHERITPLGAWLRRTSLDELPELLNVLRGEMSLVGPRPLLVRYLPHYTERERLRHSVPPGITGWAQIHGRNEVRWDDRIAKDVWYVANRTLRLDFEILVATIAMVLRRDGVVVDPHSSMLNFDEERIARARMRESTGHG